MTITHTFSTNTSPAVDNFMRNFQNLTFEETMKFIHILRENFDSQLSDEQNAKAFLTISKDMKLPKSELTPRTSSLMIRDR